MALESITIWSKFKCGIKPLCVDATWMLKVPSFVSTQHISVSIVVLLGTRFLRVWPKKVFFHEFLWFWQFFHKFPLFFHKFIACQLKFVKNRRNSWKTVKIKEIREKNTFLGQTRRNLSPQQSNKLKNLKNFTNFKNLRKSQKSQIISKNLKKSQKSQKISKNLKNLRKSQKSQKISKISKNLKNLKKSHKRQSTPSSPLGLKPHLSTSTAGFEPATSRFVTKCSTAELHGLCVFLNKNWFK